MITLLVLGMLILAVLLADTRRRLSRLEREWRRDMAPPAQPHRQAEPERRGAAIITPEEEDERDKTLVSPAGASVSSPEPVMPEPEPVPVEEVPFRLERTETAAAPEETRASAWSRPSFSFEDLFGRKLPIWAGGITLIVAAVLLVKYSIDAGLLSPPVRTVLGLVFGAWLIGLAELARRRDDLVQDARIAQSLAGAGIGSLYAATLAAANLYGLIGPGTAFAGLALITALAMLLSLRFGAPSAVLGLVGGLATPAVIQAGAPNVPLLAGYIAVVVGSLTLLSRRQRWMWLGVSALIGGAGWSLLMILMGGLGSLSLLCVGLLVLLLGIGLPVFAMEERMTPLLRGVAAVVAALQLALLVEQGDFAPLSWGLYGLLSLAFIWLTTRMPALRASIAVPLLAALALAGVWSAPPPGLFAAVMAGMVLIYGGSALWRLWRTRGSLLEAGSICAIALIGYALCRWHFHGGEAGRDMAFALLALGFGALPALGAGLGWREPARREDIRFALLASTAGLLAVIAALMALPGWMAPVSVSLVAVVLLGLAIKAEDRWLPQGALLFLAGAVFALLVTGASETELVRLVAAEPAQRPMQALLRWGAAALAAAAFAWHQRGMRRGVAVQCVAAVLGYGLAAQIVPAAWLAIAAAAGLLVLAEIMQRRQTRLLLPALATLAVIAGLWALAPFSVWVQPAMASLAGEPVFVSALPASGLTLRQLLVPSLAAGFALWRLRAALRPAAAMLGMAQIGALALVGVHILYKQLFAIDGMAAFVGSGLAERTVWEAALIGIGIALWRGLGARHAALAFIGTGFAHNLLYTLLLHDPLWSAQAVGPVPLANLLLPAFGIAFAAPLLAVRILPEQVGRARRLVDFIHMGVILLFAFASLRQLFAGSLLVGPPVAEVENIGRSVLAIVLAIGFLLWGIRQGLRDWRIASLLLMLLAVAKVFLLDASGLEGLLRIASFLALGFSLIGIGWLYSRYLRPDSAAQEQG